jgi:hypothetical protein
VHADLPSKFPAELQKRYKWGIQHEKPLPSCYIFPKRKKNFSNARPVITFYKTQFSKLYRALGKLISDITRVVYHNAFHGKTTIQTFDNLHTFLRNNSDSLHTFTWRNDDIKGFFTSIEHDVIISAFYHMLQKYCDQNTHTKASAIKFMIDYDQPAKQPRTIQGRSIKHKNRATIWLSDIIPLVELSLRTSVFVSLGKVHSQIRGSCIGNPASPPISEVPIAFKEYVWQEMFAFDIRRDCMLTRYVDNRLLIIPKEWF